MKLFLKILPALVGLFACGLIGGIGTMLAIDDSSGVAVKVVGFLALVAAFAGFYFTKRWVDNRK